MKQSKKAMIILLSCTVLVGGFSGYSMYKSLRPSRGLPYEQITMEQAMEYMSYEQDYVLVDVSDETAYEAFHIPGAVSIPFEKLVGEAAGTLPDPEQLIYVCAADGKMSRKAAEKLCDLGYTNITEIGAVSAWETLSKAETENGGQ